LGWSDQFHFFVSFGDQVKCCVVKKRDSRRDQAGLPEYCAEVTGGFSLDCWVCGIAPLDKLLVVLALPKDRDENGRRQAPIDGVRP